MSASADEVAQTLKKGTRSVKADGEHPLDERREPYTRTVTKT